MSTSPLYPTSNHPADTQVDEAGYPTHVCSWRHGRHRVLDCPYTKAVDKYQDWAYNPARS